MTSPAGIREKWSEQANTYTWIALSVLTIASWWLTPAHSGGTVIPSVPITIAAMCLALIKVRLIIRVFMEVRSAPSWLKRATDAWLIVLIASILAVYLYATLQ
jgi:hypothetical protein